MMYRKITLTALAGALSLAMAGPSLAAGDQQPGQMTQNRDLTVGVKGNPHTYAWTPLNGVSVNRVIGATAYNAAGEPIGEVEDIIIARDGRPGLVLSVGEYLGMGDRLIAIDLDHAKISGTGDNRRLEVMDDRNSLSDLPEYNETDWVRGNYPGGPPTETDNSGK